MYQKQSGFKATGPSVSASLRLLLIFDGVWVFLGGETLIPLVSGSDLSYAPISQDSSQAFPDTRLKRLHFYSILDTNTVSFLRSHNVALTMRSFSFYIEVNRSYKDLYVSKKWYTGSESKTTVGLQPGCNSYLKLHLSGSKDTK